MYQFESRIRFSETDKDRKLRLDSIVNYFQDCSNMESESLGVGLDNLNARHNSWLMTFWQIVIDRYPVLDQEVEVMTRAIRCEKIFGHRNFMIMDHGEPMVKANSIWVLTDMQTGRPVRVTPEEAALYGEAEPVEMDYAPRKIKVESPGEAGTAVIVQNYHLDIYHHMNNGQYVRLAMGCLPEYACVRELRVEYRNPATLGDVMIPVVHHEPGRTVVEWTDEEGKVYAVVAFYLE